MDFDGNWDEQKMTHVIFLIGWPFYKQKPKH
jgi:hypothetical protein